MERIDRQIAFTKEIDKLKDVYRRSYLLSQSRMENSAEHSWHISVMAMFLSEYSNVEIDRLRVIEMLLIHDIVEVDAGDTYCYDENSTIGKEQREEKAANRLFHLLPGEQADRLMRLRHEFEEAKTPESLFANALDRFMPLIHNFSTMGRAWKENGITKGQVLKRNKSIADGSHALWEYAKHRINEASEKGWLKNDDDPNTQKRETDNDTA
ncbi:MAG: HD domain-containing protein [Desulfobacterales bacterium]